MEDTSTGSESEPRPDASDDEASRDAEPPAGGDPDAATVGAAEDTGDGTADADAADELDDLRRRVEEEYDFDDFGPSDMARMSAEEWDAAFDPDSWITGDRLLERAEAELKTRIARRDVFGVLERVRADGEERLLVYSDEGYAIVRPSGEVAGQGTVLRDIEPIVALASMEAYDVPEPPDDWSLPHPDTVPEGSGEFGNLLVRNVAANSATPAMGIVFLLIGFFLFVMVANARLSDRFRSEEYRGRLRALREAKERPDFVPVEGGVVTEDETDE